MIDKIIKIPTREITIFFISYFFGQYPSLPARPGEVGLRTFDIFMRNVWAVPSIPTLKSWMYEAGLTDVHLLDVSRTTVEEQRSTEWMRFESLEQCLHPKDPSRTVEGHPAPARVALLATA